MEIPEKYHSPAIEVLELRPESVIAGSADPEFVNPFSGGESNWN